MKIRIWFILLVVFFILSCTKSSTSPDEIILLPPENLQFEKISLTSIRLVWQDVCECEEGYIIEKIFMGEITNSISLPENSEEYLDEDMIPGRNYSYKVYSYCDNRFSYGRINLVNTFPIWIYDLEYDIIDSVTVKLTWNESYNFEHGFKIDKSVGWDNWENEIAILDENSVEWIDYSVIPEHYYYYRIYPYFDEFDGEKIGIGLDSSNYFVHFIILSDFSIASFQNYNQINWTTKAEIDNIGWNIIRSESSNAIWNDEVIVINYNPIAGAGTTNEPTGYQYYDNQPIENGIMYCYWLECYNSIGSKRIYGPNCYTHCGK